MDGYKMSGLNELQKIVMEIDNVFDRAPNRNNAVKHLHFDEWLHIRTALPYEALKHGNIAASIKADPEIPVIDRAGAMRAASLRALKAIVDTSSMTELEWRAAVINLIERMEKFERDLSGLK